MLKASNENTKKLRLKVKIELQFDPAGPLLGLSLEKTRIEKKQAGKGALQQYSQ